MQRRARPKNSRQQVIGKLCVNCHSTLDVGAQPDLPLDDDQRARLVLREQVRRHHDVVVGIAFGNGAMREGQASAQPCKRLPYLRSKNYYQRENRIGEEPRDQPIQRRELADSGKIKRKNDDRDADQNECRASAANQRQEFINDDRDQHYVDDRDHR